MLSLILLALLYSKRMNLAQLPIAVAVHKVQLVASCTGCHYAPLHLYFRRPRRHPPRALPSPPSPRPTEDGGLVAQEPRLHPRRHCPPRRRLPAQRAALPRRVRRRRLGAHPPPPLEGPGQRPRGPSILPGRLLPGAPPALDPGSPSGHRARNRRPPGPDPGACLFKKALGLRWRKVGTIPAKADPQEQADFVTSKLRPRLRQAGRGDRTVLFLDAAHFVYGPFLGFLCCLVRLLVPGPSGRKRSNVLAALNAATHEVIRGAHHSYVNAGTRCALPRQVVAAGLPRPITLVLDNARYQRCHLVQALARSLRIELLFLPSYSPNLNLIERLWKFVKKDCLAARSLENYEAFTAAIDDCLNNLSTKHKAKMDTLLTLNFQTFDNVSVLAA